MVTYGTTDKDIKLPFPHEAFSKFMKEANATDEENLTEEQIKKIFVLTVDTFLTGEISTDDIASICGAMMSSAQRLEDRKEADLVDALEAGSELGYYVRNQGLLPQFNRFLKEVLEFAEEYKE